MKSKSRTLDVKRMVRMGNQLSKAKQIQSLGKIIGMKAKFFAENPDNMNTQDLEYVLEKMRELESFLK